jgi:hypothetical protein
VYKDTQQYEGRILKILDPIQDHESVILILNVILPTAPALASPWLLSARPRVTNEVYPDLTSHSHFIEILNSRSATA